MSVGTANGELGQIVRIGIVVGSTRPGRRARVVAEWAGFIASEREAAVFEIVDLDDYDLPLLDEPVPAAMGGYRQPHTKRWSEVIDRFDGYVFVTPEYNHSFPGALKNAIDFLYSEWQNKAAGLLTYGLSGGIRAGEQLRLVLAELKVASVRSHVALTLRDDFDLTDDGALNPSPQQVRLFERMLDEIVEWAAALRTVRIGNTPPDTNTEER